MNSNKGDIEFFSNWYESIEGQFKTLHPYDGKSRYLCDRLENESEPIHSWYNLKEAFSSRFPQWAVKRLQDDYDFYPTRVLDPFAGGGTSPLAFTHLGFEAGGVEYNPFIAWAAELKASWSEVDPGEVERAIAQIKIRIPTGMRLTWPKITTFHRSQYFRQTDVRTMLYFLHQIAQLDTTERTKDFLRLGIAGAVDSVANLHKDGRALRYVPKTNRPHAEEAINQRWSRNLQHLKSMHAEFSDGPYLRAQIWRGSATNLKRLHQRLDGTTTDLPNSSFDLVFYSPPYLNNFDYSEIYKLELWLLGFVKDYHEWREVREGTLRSHHSIKFPATQYLATTSETEEISELLLRMSRSAYLTGYTNKTMPSVIVGYFDDMFLALREQFRVLRPGGFVIFMVANSCHSNLPIATDLILGEIARKIGFEPLELSILRQRNGRKRGGNFVRESVVFLRKSRT